MFLLEGRGDAADGWAVGSLVAIQPRLVLALDQVTPESIPAALAQIDRLRAERSLVSRGANTGLAVLLGYNALNRSVAAQGNSRLPDIVVLEVDRSIVASNGRFEFSSPDVERWLESISGQREVGVERVAAHATGAARTSLPRERYLAAVEKVRQAIARGEVYQANLCQQLSCDYRGDPLEYFRNQLDLQPAPRAAFLSTHHGAMASLSPETFVVSDGKNIQTVPIKGTRPRYDNLEQDRAAAAELLASEKDRAELLMIVDLERNDFGRICRTGSVNVTELAALRSYSNVHHLVAKVHGELKQPFQFSHSLAAIYPGGSITGAPKIASMRLLERLEPRRREWFTGSLFWCADDGSIDSSILIRTVQFTQDEALIGAGGGVVTDSDPETEWHESNHKVRGLTQTLGFDPQEAR